MERELGEEDLGSRLDFVIKALCDLAYYLLPKYLPQSEALCSH